MSSFPFQPHPTLAEYLRWAEESGCEVRTGHIDTVPLVRIKNNANGRLVVQANIKQTEHLNRKLWPGWIDGLA